MAARCRWGRPTVISVAPVIDGGERFPTTFWLTCPHLVRLVGDAESGGAASRWTERVAGDEALARRVEAADAAYRDSRRRLGGGVDPCAEVGIAGQKDPRIVKCVHARVAACLGGIADPVGEGALQELVAKGLRLECDADTCVG